MWKFFIVLRKVVGASNRNRVNKPLPHYSLNLHLHNSRNLVEDLLPWNFICQINFYAGLYLVKEITTIETTLAEAHLGSG